MESGREAHGNSLAIARRLLNPAKMRASALVLAAGMGIEPYLKRLKDTS